MNKLLFYIRQGMAKFFLKRRVSTSLSDNMVYPNFCLKASHDMSVFSTFRLHPVYRSILEHVRSDHARSYLSEIIKYPEMSGHWDEFKRNDEWGSPKLHRYLGIGRISSTTLRYVKVLNDLRLNFNSLNDWKIAEIGVGYGGQCRIINSLYKPRKYTLVDIKPALMLAQRYLDNYILSSPVEYRTMNELEQSRYDLVISNYAFTELPRMVQNVYLKKIILNSAAGYITFNENDRKDFYSYKKEDLLRIIPGSRMEDEVPLTSSGNCLILWGTGDRNAPGNAQNGIKKDWITA